MMHINLCCAAPSNAWCEQINELASLLVDYHNFGLYPFGDNCRPLSDSDLTHAEKGVRLILQMNNSFENLRLALRQAYDPPRYIGTLGFACAATMCDSLLGYQEYFMRALCMLEPIHSVRKYKILESNNLKD